MPVVALCHRTIRSRRPSTSSNRSLSAPNPVLTASMNAWAIQSFGLTFVLAFFLRFFSFFFSTSPLRNSSARCLGLARTRACQTRVHPRPPADSRQSRVRPPGSPPVGSAFRREIVGLVLDERAVDLRSTLSVPIRPMLINSPYVTSTSESSWISRQCLRAPCSCRSKATSVMARFALTSQTIAISGSPGLGREDDVWSVSRRAVVRPVVGPRGSPVGANLPRMVDEGQQGGGHHLHSQPLVEAVHLPDRVPGPLIQDHLVVGLAPRLRIQPQGLHRATPDIHVVAHRECVEHAAKLAEGRVQRPVPAAPNGDRDLTMHDCFSHAEASSSPQDPPATPRAGR